MKFRFRTIVGLFCETGLIGNTEQKCSFYRKIAKETKRTNFLTCTTDKRLRLKNIKKLDLLKMEERLTKVWRILPKWVKEKGTKMCKIEVSSYLDLALPLCLKVSKSRNHASNYGIQTSSKKRKRILGIFSRFRKWFFVHFLGELKIPKRCFEIKWHLEKD